MSVVLITGTSTGIGLATAVDAAAWIRVFASMRDTSRSDGLRVAAAFAGVELEMVELGIGYWTGGAFMTCCEDQ